MAEYQFSVKNGGQVLIKWILVADGSIPEDLAENLMLDMRDGLLASAWDVTPVVRVAETREEVFQTGNCPYDHSHTRQWCGYERCREG
jgi:hypothetical protein